MTYKPEQAQLFYAALTGMQNPPLVWQWFCDYDKDRRDLAGWEYAYMNPAKLADIQARGCGVFTSVNGSTTGGRGKNDIDIFRAVFMDSDGAPFPDQWPIPPHAIVKRDDTHFHAYWFIDGDCSAMEWMIAQKQIALHFGSDESMVNPDRVMRVPGFMHQKSLDNRVLYELAELHADMPRYKLRDIISRFTLTDEKMMKMGEWVRQRSAQYVGGMDDFDDNEHNCKQFITYLKNRAEQSISGQGGNHVLFKTAAAGRDYQLSPQKTYELMIDYWDANNEPPWGDEMWPTVQNVYKYSQNGVGARSFAARITEPAAMLPGMSLTPVEQAIYMPETVTAVAPKAADISAAVVEARKSGKVLVDTIDYSKNHTTNAQKFLLENSAHGEIIICEDQFYMFDGKVFKSVAPGWINGMVAREMELVAPSDSDVKGTVSMIKNHLIVQAPAKWPEFKNDPDRDTSGLIAFDNGILDINNGNTMIAHSPDIRIRAHLPYSYDPTATCPQWEAFLYRVWGQSKYEPLIEQLQMWFGYMLTDDISQQKMLIMSGVARSGKSTMMRILHAMLGSHNCASPTLDNLTNEAHLQGMYDKLGAFLNDVSDPSPANRTAVVNRIKNIVGQDDVRINRKYQSTIEVTMRCRLNMTCNAIPNLSESSSAMVERGLFFHTPRSFKGREDSDLTEKLRAEMPGIINWAIIGLKKLREVKRLKNHECMEERIRVFKAATSPLDVFVQSALIVREGTWAPLSDVFKRYRDWAADNDGGGTRSLGAFARMIDAMDEIEVGYEGDTRVLRGAFIRPIEEPDNGILYE